MTCAIEGCLRSTAVKPRLDPPAEPPLCPVHQRAWSRSGEASREAEIIIEETDSAETRRRAELAFTDFIRRISAEERSR